MPTIAFLNNVDNSINAFSAFRALLLELHTTKSEHDIKTVVVTPFCTGVGGMSPEKSAVQMKLAYDTIIKPVSGDWLGHFIIKNGLT